MAISESSMKEGVDFLGAAPEKFVNISTAADECFKQIDQSVDVVGQLHAKLGISRQFVLYTGGADSRKNLARLIEAYSTLS